MSPTTAGRVQVVRQELARLKHPSTSKGVHEHRQQQLMRACEARLRKPQRSTVLSVLEERARWMTTLQAYDRLLWEAMGPAELQERVVDAEAFVDSIEDALVIHADQVPCWLRIGSQKQLYGNAEVRKRKRHELSVPNLAEVGGQQQNVEDDDGMAQTRHGRPDRV